MPQQVGKYDFSGIPAAADFEGIPKASPAAAPAPTGKSWTDVAVDALPMVGGTVGGIVGGIGGTVGGMGVGGIPGAMGGATLGGGAGEALRQLIERFRGNAAPDSALEAAKQIAVEGGTQGAIEGAGGLVAKGVQSGARAVVRGYLKPSLAGVKIDKARAIVQTAMDEALPVTKGGEERAGRLIAELNKQISSTLQGVKGKVDLRKVADKVRTFAKAKYFKPGVDDADFRAAMDVADQIDNHASMALPGGGQVTRVNASAANDIKQTVRPNSRAFGQQGAAPEAATRKVAGSEMRQAIEDVATKEGHDQVGAMNAREGRLIDAQEAIKRAAGREENKGLNPTAVPNLIAGGLGMGDFAQQRDPASAIATALAVRAALSPAVMTRAAILASRLAKNGYTAATAARIAVEMAQSEEQGQRDP